MWKRKHHEKPVSLHKYKPEHLISFATVADEWSVCTINGVYISCILAL